ncbi:MAG TPA: hypothetical protein VH650_11565 [Gaiellaceae bacterium]|jgi:hypothetical protein
MADVEGDIAGIVTRLRDEIRANPDASRARAERAWAVTAERPFEGSPTRHGGVQAYLVVPVKRLLRKLMRWYVEPVAAQQRSFNLALLTLVDELADEVRRLEQQVESLEARLDNQRR